MEPILPNSDDDSEMLRSIRSVANLPQEDTGLSKKRKIQIVLATICSLGVVLMLVFFSGGNKSGKEITAIAAVNRGLMQAEDIRRQKDLLDQKRKNTGEEEWERRFHALRDSASKIDSMPDPVPMLPVNGKISAQPFGGNPGKSGLEAPYSDSIQESFHISNPSKEGHRGMNFGPGFSSPERGNRRETVGEPMAETQGFRLNSKMTERMSDEYQKALAYNASEQLVFTRDRSAEVQKTVAPAKAVSTGISTGTKVAVSAGDELRAVLTESISSDYPSVVKATLTSPAELSGSMLLLSYSLGEERVAAQVVKLILPKKEGERAKEMTLAAVVKSGLPGLGGDVSHHWIPQIAAGLANAGITGGALAYASQNSNKDLGTAVLVAPMIEQSVQGLLKPINYLGRDRPVTVNVPAGTEFTLLVTEGFEVEL